MIMVSDRQDPQTELALRAGKGDGQALAELIVDCTDSTRAIINERMSSRSMEDREDMYQTIMLHLCRNISSFKGKSRFFSWFWQMQANKIIDYYRSRPSSNRNKDILMADPTYDRPDRVTEPEWYNVYDEYKGLLPERHYHYLDIVYDREVNEYTLSELAEKYDEHYEAIWSRYRRGKVALRKDLEKQGITY